MEASTYLFTIAIVLFIIEIIIMLAFIAPVLMMVFQILKKFNGMLEKVARLEEMLEDKVGLMVKGLQALPDVMKKAEKVVTNMRKKRSSKSEE
jgi:hypothetical protein